MDFIISNRRFKDAKEYNGCFYLADETIQINGMLGFYKTYEFGKNKNILISNFQKLLEDNAVNRRISTESFYLGCYYSKHDQKLYIQTDIVGSIPVYFYSNNRTIFVSSNVLELVSTVAKLGFPVSLDEKEVRKFVYSGSLYSNRTIFNNITSLSPATISCIDFACLKQCNNKYHYFKFNHKIQNETEAAKRLYAVIDNVFSRHYETDLLYGLGVSGGLDSRVAGYFAKKYDYKIAPFFIGREKNEFGIRTNDACRSIEVAEVLHLPDVEFVDNIKLSYIDKLKFDAYHSPLGSANVSQNIGFGWRTFDVLLHGMLGGELFGGISFLNHYTDSKNAHQIAELYINSMCQVPKSIAKYSLSGKLLNKLPYIRNFYAFKDKSLIIDDKTYKDFIQQIENSVQKDLSDGYTDTNILLKLFVYNQSKNTSQGYYSTLEETVPSLGVYFNPLVLEELMNWNDSMFYDRKVQKQLLLICGELSKVRDQTIHTSISEGYNKSDMIRKNLFERIVRGSGMFYQTYSVKSFDDTLDELGTTDTVKLFPLDFKTLMLSKSYISDCILKIALIEKEYKLLYS